MKKIGLDTERIEKRKVIRVCEVKEEVGKGKSINFSSNSVQLVDIFRWDPISDAINERTDLFETPALHSIREYEALTRSMFEEEIHKYKLLFETLVERKEIDVSCTTKLFGDIHRDQIDVENKTRSSSVETPDQADKAPSLGNS
jgi:hypothetical protein